MNQADRDRWRSYVIGVLRSAQFVANGHGEDSIAGEMVSRLLDGESLSSLQRLSRTEEIRFKRGFWREVHHWFER